MAQTTGAMLVLYLVLLANHIALSGIESCIFCLIATILISIGHLTETCLFRRHVQYSNKNDSASRIWVPPRDDCIAECQRDPKNMVVKIVDLIDARRIGTKAEVLLVLDRPLEAVNLSWTCILPQEVLINRYRLPWGREARWRDG